LSRVASVLSQHRKFALLTGELRPLIWLAINVFSFWNVFPWTLLLSIPISLPLAFLQLPNLD
jgi:hypothetical protein